MCLVRRLQEILTESFDPILDLVTGADLMMAMVYAQELGDWDYTGMYTAVLRRRVSHTSSPSPCRPFCKVCRPRALNSAPPTLVHHGSLASSGYATTAQLKELRRVMQVYEATTQVHLCQ